MDNHVFFASTPFNVLTAAMTAFELDSLNSKSYLYLIDQTNEMAGFREALFQWDSSPFESIELVSKKTSGLKKRSTRKQSFRKINELISELSPAKIYTGNDRRIEFQYAMHCSNATGVYLDDGLYSYLGKKSHWFKDRILDNLIKKLSYGHWWKQPPNIGGSSWIKEAILAFPETAHPLLTTKNCFNLASNLHRAEFHYLANLCLEPQLKEDVKSIKSLLLLPHSSNLTDATNQIQMNWLKNNSESPAVKHHPRTSPSFNWPSMPDKVRVIPSHIPMEILLPLLPINCNVAGGLTTSLLTTKWLRPDINVFSSELETEEHSSTWATLIHTLKIQPIKYG